MKKIPETFEKFKNRYFPEIEKCEEFLKRHSTISNKISTNIITAKGGITEETIHEYLKHLQKIIIKENERCSIAKLLQL